MQTNNDSFGLLNANNLLILLTGLEKHIVTFDETILRKYWLSFGDL